MNVEIGTEAMQFPEKEYIWDFPCSVAGEGEETVSNAGQRLYICEKFNNIAAVWFL
jgi:hypothetical protein